MSGSIIFSDQVAWFKARWAYRATLAGICEVLADEKDGARLLSELSDETGNAVAAQNIEVASWTEAERKVFYSAVHKACALLRSKGPSEWNDPSFFPGFLTALDELEAKTTSVENENGG
jgi:uncharacterized protein (UPF0332 family)